MFEFLESLIENNIQTSRLVSTPFDQTKCFNSDGSFVVYWMRLSRRISDNAALATAMVLAHCLGQKLLILETLWPFGPFVNRRHQAFVIEGVLERVQKQKGYQFIPTQDLSPSVSAVLKQASAVVTDWEETSPCPQSTQTLIANLKAQAPGLPILLVDDVGLVPVHDYKKAEAAARFLRPKLVPYLKQSRLEFAGIQKIIKQFDSFVETQPDPQISKEQILNELGPRGPEPVKDFQGGERQALKRLKAFLQNDLTHYAERQHPDKAVSSGLSPYFHFGMIHSRTILDALCKQTGAPSPDRFHKNSNVSKFVDEFVTWRELAFNMAHFAYVNHIQLGDVSLVPSWALKTLREHPPKATEVLPLETLEKAQTPDKLWNAAQQELLQTGRIQNYLRMLWGKGIVRWSSSPEEALARMEYLNNTYALDGSDAASYLNFYWCLGKFDRPWPPARAPFGMVRAMSTRAAAKKLKLNGYLSKYS